MKTTQYLNTIILFFLINAAQLTAESPISGRSWKSVAADMPDDWYGSEESIRVADNVLLFQREIGGWPKNIPFHKPLTDVERASVANDKGRNDAIFDNGATTTEMKFLARIYNKTKTEAYKSAFIRGLNFITGAQYANGGWPMFYPLRKGYYTHITFNDNAIVNILEMLRDIFNHKQLFTFVTDDEIIAQAKRSFTDGIGCILKTQIIVRGKPTVWCAQHDENNFLPAKARSYELPSFSGGESVGIVNLLMSIPNPSPEIIASVQGAIEWFDTHRLKNTRWAEFVNTEGQKDRKIVTDPDAGDMWARFYDLDTELPFVCDRDGIKKKTIEEIGYERRNGYGWYTDEPQRVIEKFSAWKAKWKK